MTPASVYEFDPQVGPRNPYSCGMIQASDGQFYGVAGGGGSANQRSLFTMDLTGNVSAVYYFNGTSYDCSGPLLEAADGDLYSVSSNSDSGSAGMIVRFRPSGSSNVYLKVFTSITTTGEMPSGPLIQGTDGYVYGTTLYGGQFGKGVVYKVGVGVSVFVRRYG